MSVAKACEEVIDFIAARSSPSDVPAFRPSEGARTRVSALLDRQKEGRLTTDEASELEHYPRLEHIMRWLRPARASISRRPQAPSEHHVPRVPRFRLACGS